MSPAYSVSRSLVIPGGGQGWGVPRAFPKSHRCCQSRGILAEPVAGSNQSAYFRRRTMNWILLSTLIAACGILILIEKSGVRTTLTLKFKGDVKRETRWLAQYGQAVCTIVAAILVLQLDPQARKCAVAILAATFGVSIVAMLIKRLVGRVRPNRPGAGKFLGPTLSNENFRESFPSSHS